MENHRRTRRVAAALWIGIFASIPSSGAAGAETCDRWAAKVVSVQGSVEAQRAGEPRPRPIAFKETLCPGDTIRVPERSRADLLLPNETLLRLDQNTTVKFSGPEKERISLVDLIIGAAYFISRTPRKFNVHTPFVNAGVEGTEFLARVENDKTLLTVFEGRVLATNMEGGLLLTGGMSGVAEAGKAPALRVVARPRDAVQWTLYYPQVLPPGEGVSPEDTPSDWRARVSHLLSVGRVEEARAEIDERMKKAPGDGTAYALLAVIAVAQNEKDKAFELAKKAVEADPRSAPARIALSYALQARFDLAGALGSLQDAVKAEPGNALAWARLAEMRMSFGDLDEALKAAKKAVELSPDLARAQSVLGYAYLAQVNTTASRESFEKAIGLDQADPLPRLGLGLATIREGDLARGREAIEVAASLDPGNSLVRSYLGKAYYEEKRDRAASSQLEMAKELDPNDPTPYFYDAIRKQTLNRPVEALHDLQKSISLNDNRSVYRSKLLLDEDLAARSASLGRIYDDLGFQQLALAEGWKSLTADPANYSAHRFLSDSYSALPRHEIARVSELLQSQLLQPINITPVQPHLAQSNLSVPGGSGPADLSFNEFNPLFNRNRFALQAGGVAGSSRTYGEEIVHSAVQGRLSYSIGQYHYQTAGFRTNGDIRNNLYNAFLQGSLTHKTSLQAEFRSKDGATGDPGLRFHPDDFAPFQRQSEKNRSIRLGFRHSFSPGSDLIGSFLYEKATSGLIDSAPFVIGIDTGEHRYGFELQHLFRTERLSVIAGAGYFNQDRRDVFNLSLPNPFDPVNNPPIPLVVDDVTENDIHHANAYLYALFDCLKRVTFTIGASADFLNDAKDTKGSTPERSRFNPKLGLTWSPAPGTTLRAAAFRVFTKTLPLTQQTLEPTQVAGFNQFFDDSQGTESRRYGVGVDRKFSADLSGGAEISRRSLDVPVNVNFAEFSRTDWKERLGRAYLYWTPDRWLALTAEYQYERFDFGETRNPGVVQVTTQRYPLGAGMFHPSGLILRARATFFDQEGRFKRVTDLALPSEPGSDRFWIVDASAGYRLPDRWGIVSVEAKNLFDKSFNFQDTDPHNPVIQPKRTIYFKCTLAI
jgi:tetratricopeptide (TPR) repeat protein